jgi:hypothetical protein
VGCRPIAAFTEAPKVDEITDDIQRFTRILPEEIQQKFSLASLELDEHRNPIRCES